MKNKALLVFIVGSLIIALVLFLFPINLFDGVVVYQDGVQGFELEQPLSLSYFIGIGYDQADMDIVEYFYLKPKGWIMALIFIFGIPGIIAYRIHLTTKK
jgi:hypothetical protein